MATAAELGRVSVPPGPNVTVPVGESVCPDVPAAGVTLTVTIMVCGGFAAFLVEPPRLAVVQVIVPLLEGSAGPPQIATPPLCTVAVTELMTRPTGTTLVNTTFCATVVVVLLMVQMMFPACPTFGRGFWAVTASEIAAEPPPPADEVVVVLLALLLTRAVPAKSVPLTVAELVMVWFCI